MTKDREERQRHRSQEQAQQQQESASAASSLPEEGGEGGGGAATARSELASDLPSRWSGFDQSSTLEEEAAEASASAMRTAAEGAASRQEKAEEEALLLSLSAGRRGADTRTMSAGSRGVGDATIEGDPSIWSQARSFLTGDRGGDDGNDNAFFTSHQRNISLRSAVRLGALTAEAGQDDISEVASQYDVGSLGGFESTAPSVSYQPPPRYPRSGRRGAGGGTVRMTRSGLEPIGEGTVSVAREEESAGPGLLQRVALSYSDSSVLSRSKPYRGEEGGYTSSDYTTADTYSTGLSSSKLTGRSVYSTSSNTSSTRSTFTGLGKSLSSIWSSDTGPESEASTWGYRSNLLTGNYSIPGEKDRKLRQADMFIRRRWMIPAAAIAVFLVFLSIYLALRSKRAPLTSVQGTVDSGAARSEFDDDGVLFGGFFGGDDAFGFFPAASPAVAASMPPTSEAMIHTVPTLLNEGSASESTLGGDSAVSSGGSSEGSSGTATDTAFDTETGTTTTTTTTSVTTWGAEPGAPTPSPALLESVVQNVDGSFSWASGAPTLDPALLENVSIETTTETTSFTIAFDSAVGQPTPDPAVLESLLESVTTTTTSDGAVELTWTLGSFQPTPDPAIFQSLVVAPVSVPTSSPQINSATGAPTQVPNLDDADDDRPVELGFLTFSDLDTANEDDGPSTAEEGDSPTNADDVLEVEVIQPEEDPLIAVNEEEAPPLSGPDLVTNDVAATPSPQVAVFPVEATPSPQVAVFPEPNPNPQPPTPQVAVFPPAPGPPVPSPQVITRPVFVPGPPVPGPQVITQPVFVPWPPVPGPQFINQPVFPQFPQFVQGPNQQFVSNPQQQGPNFYSPNLFYPQLNYQQVGNVPITNGVAPVRPPVALHNLEFVGNCHSETCVVDERSEYRKALSYEDDAIYEIFYTNPIKCCGVIVEVGAGNGVDGSVSHWFEKAMNWKAVLIEANPVLYRALDEARPDALSLNLGFCEYGSMKFDGEFHTNEPNDVVSELISDRPPENDAETVMCLNFNPFLKSQGITHIDVMVIHVDGDPLAVIRKMDWTIRVDIWIILFENPQDVTAQRQEQIEERRTVVEDVLERNLYVEAEWDIKRWCGIEAGSCRNNRVWLRRNFNPLHHRALKGKRQLRGTV